MPIDPNNLANTARLTFSDEFNNLNIWNGTSGAWSTNFWWNDEWGKFATSSGVSLPNNGELQWYINDNYAPTAAINPWSVSNGVLSLTAQPAGALQSLLSGYQYTSGMINSWHSFSQAYGYFEISAKLPAGNGLWPAFWLMPKDGSERPEIDIFEVHGSDPRTLYNTAISGFTGTKTQDQKATTVADMSAGFHRYGVNWQADYITYYFDGQATAKFATPPDMHKPMYIIANLAVGGYWVGNPDASTVFPAQLQIDYIRAYSEATATTAMPAPVTTTSPISQATSPGGGDDVIAGTSLRDELYGQGGNDSISGGDGDDYIRGDAGDDQLDGGAGFDDINGNMGNDTLHGGAGPDWVVGGQDQDLLFGDDDGDIVYGNLGNDTCDGGLGADLIRGGQGDDSLAGGAGDDWLSGDRGSDTLTGGAGADVFHTFGAAGVDRVLDFSRAEGDRVMVDLGTNWTVSQGAEGVVVDMDGGGQMILVGVTLQALTGDWIFAG